MEKKGYQFNTDELVNHVEKLDKRLARSGWAIIILVVVVLFTSLYIITHQNVVPNQTHPNLETDEEVMVEIEKLNERLDKIEEKLNKSENN